MVEDNKSREKEKTVEQKRKMIGGRVCNKRKVNGLVEKDCQVVRQ